MITPNEFQSLVLASPARLKLIRGKPRIGKTMLAALLAHEASLRGDDVWYRSPYRTSVDVFVDYLIKLNKTYTPKKIGSTIKVGARIFASVTQYRERGYYPEVLILDQIDTLPDHYVESYMAAQNINTAYSVLIYDPMAYRDTDDHPLTYCEQIYVKSLLKTTDIMLQEVFDYSPLLPGGYINFNNVNEEI